MSQATYRGRANHAKLKSSRLADAGGKLHLLVAPSISTVRAPGLRPETSISRRTPRPLL